MFNNKEEDPRICDESLFRIDYSQPIPLSLSELPLELPETDDFAPGDNPEGCLAKIKDWRYFQKDGEWFARETNTMPQWAGSCWYVVGGLALVSSSRGVVFCRLQSECYFIILLSLIF